MIYEALKTLHVLSAAVLFGTGMGIAFFQFMAWRTKDVALFAGVARLTVIADWLFTASAVIAQPITGVALMLHVGYSWNEPWLLWAYALYAVAGLFWAPVVAMQMRVAKLSAEARDANAPIPEDAHRLMRAWFWCGWPAFAAVLATYWLMIARPA